MIILHPVATEKAIRMIESENKLAFVVDRNATKATVAKEIERLFSVKVVGVNLFTGPDGKKRAYVRLAPENPAIDLATKLGLM